MKAFLLAILVWAAMGAVPAPAQEFPALYTVDGVRETDVLNVRAGPGVNHPIVGTLEHDQTGIEVLRTERRWAMINMGEQTGWASLKFLAPQTGGTLVDASRLRCFGTEPFWGLDIQPGKTAVLTTPDSIVGDVFDLGSLKRMQSPLQKYLLRGQHPSRQVSVVLQHAYCDDGMSDRAFGIDATVVLSGSDGRVLSGCCSLDP